jgi:DNA anti-recombination protein RmuC
MKLAMKPCYEKSVNQVEDTIEEVKRRSKNVKSEIKDVVKAVKEVANQAGDVVKAIKGKKRQGRKSKNKK